MEMDIASKKFYNRYIPKIFRATTFFELNELQKIIGRACVIKEIKESLLNAISVHRKTIEKMLRK